MLFENAYSASVKDQVHVIYAICTLLITTHSQYVRCYIDIKGAENAREGIAFGRMLTSHKLREWKMTKRDNTGLRTMDVA